MPNYDLIPEYEALYNSNDENIFDDEEYDKLKKAGRLPEGRPTEISSEAILKALENLDLKNGANIDAKQRIRDQKWYGTGVESDELKKAKYGDIPEKLADEPPPEEDKPLERGDKWDPQVSEEDALRDRLGSGGSDDEEGPNNIDEILAALDKPDVAVTKTTVSKGEAKKPVGKEKPKDKSPVSSVSKERVELSADTLKPKEKSSLWDTKGDGMKFEGPEEKGKKDFQGKLEKDYKGVPFHEGGVNEEELFGFVPGAEHKGVGEALADIGTTAVLGTAAGRALKPVGKYLGGKVGRLLGKMKGEPADITPSFGKSAPKAIESSAPPADITPSFASRKAQALESFEPPAGKLYMESNKRIPMDEAQNVFKKNAETAAAHGGRDSLMFSDVAGRPTKGVGGAVGRRLGLIEKGAGEGSGLTKHRAPKEVSPEAGGNRSSVHRVHIPKANTPWSATDITLSDTQRIIDQLAHAAKTGKLDAPKYANFLRRLGRSEAEVEAELLRAGMKK